MDEEAWILADKHAKIQAKKISQLEDEILKLREQLFHTFDGETDFKQVLIGVAMRCTCGALEVDDDDDEEEDEEEDDD